MGECSQEDRQYVLRAARRPGEGPCPWIGRRQAVSLCAMLLPDRRAWHVAALAAGCIVAGVMFGMLEAVRPLAGIFVLGMALLALAALARHHIAILAAVAAAYLLPFGVMTLPLTGLHLSFLDAAITGALFLWLSRILLRRDTPFRVTPVGVPVLVYIGVIVAALAFSFDIEDARSIGTATGGHLRQFIKMLNSILFYFTIVNTIKGERLVKYLTLTVLVAATAQAALALLLYVIPRDTAISGLSALSVFGYPSGAEVLRNIAGTDTLRATGTSIDPNILGGVLMLTLPLFVSLFFSKRRLISRPLLIPMCGLVLAALLLSYSRSAWIGGTAGVLFVATLKYRRAWLLVAFVGAVLFILPIGHDFIERFVSGVFFQDKAAQMRLGEYKDALRLISEYPWLGVGFGASPREDLYVAVSSMYLLIAEQAGLVGLSAFLAIVMVFLAWNIYKLKRVSQTSLEPIHIGAMGGVVGALVAGIFDHYFFNMQFPHTIVLFWLFVGLTTTAGYAAEEPVERENAVRALES
ncbi:MAG: hypothetical protein EXR50_05350 [Dehalococcoidia bacterium]|nr:hypothetical protein [Dehalococcoidia bacterium]